MSTYKENEHPRDKSGQWVNKHKSVKPGIELGQTFFSPQSGTFGEAYREQLYIEIPPIVGTQLKGDDGYPYEVSDYTFSLKPVITSVYTGDEADSDMLFDVEKLPTGQLSTAYMSKMENGEKKFQSWRDFDEEKENLEVIDCKSPREADIYDGLVDAREAEVWVVDKDGNMFSTDEAMPSKYRRMIHKYRMWHFWTLKEETATDNYEHLLKELKHTNER